MKNTEPTIFSINPGTRYLGVAILRGDTLIDWTVHVIANGSLSVKLASVRTLIDRYIAEYEPNMMVMKRLHPARSTTGLAKQCRDIERQAAVYYLPIHSYSIDEIKQFLLPHQRINKMTLSKVISEYYPVLNRLFQREQNALNPYHVRMFEAVALGRVCQGMSCHHQ